MAAEAVTPARFAAIGLRAAAVIAGSAVFGYFLGAADGWAILVSLGRSPAVQIAELRRLGLPLSAILFPGPVPDAAFLATLVAAVLGPICYFAVLRGRASVGDVAVVAGATGLASVVWAYLVGLSVALFTPIALLAAAFAVRVVHDDRDDRDDRGHTDHRERRNAA